MEEKIRQLIEEELARANEKFPGFASAHEGWAVLKEEIEELDIEVSEIKKEIEWLWKKVKQNDPDLQECGVVGIHGIAIRLIAEAIQVAAMARKFEQFLERREKVE